MLKFQKFSQGMYRCSSIFSNFALSIFKAEVLLHSRRLSSWIFLHITFVIIVLVSSMGIPVEKLQGCSFCSNSLLVLVLFKTTCWYFIFL